MRTIPVSLAAVLVLAGTLPAQSVVVGVGGEASAPVASEISVPVFADLRPSGGHLLGSYTIRIQWDPAVLQYDGFAAGAFGVPVVQEDSSFTAGVLYVAGVNVNGQSGVVDLFTLQLHVLQAQTSAITLTVLEMSAAGTFTDLKSLTTVVNTTFCGSLGRWGDLDNDGFANSRDALAILSSAVGLTVDPSFDLTRGDVNVDAKTNTVDALIILSYAVGLDIPGQRVLLPVPGACAAGDPPTLAIAPDSADLVVGQRVRLKLQAISASGELVTFAAGWQVVDPRIATVDGDGRLLGHLPGSTRVVAALGPGVRASIPVVVRARRSTWHVNAALAKRASVQLGTSVFPFSTPQRAFPFVREGDTIRVAPGRHDYEDPYEEGLVYGEDFSDEVRFGIVILGDTLPDGTRPVLGYPGSLCCYEAVEWIGGARGEVRDLVLQGFQSAVSVRGLANLTIRNVRFDAPMVTYGGHGIQTNSRFDTLRVERSEFLGSASFAGYGLNGDRGGRVLLVSNSTFTSWESGAIRAYEVDSVDLRDNVLSSLSNGVHLEHSYQGQPMPTSLVLRNQITCEPGGLSVGIQITGTPANLEDNAMRGPCQFGIHADNVGATPELPLGLTRDTVLLDSVTAGWTAVRVSGNWQATIRGNRIRKGYNGLEIATTGPSPVVIDSNAVSQAGSAGILINVPNGVNVTGRKNNIQNNLAYGIKSEAYTAGTRSFTLSHIVGNAIYGVYNLGTAIFEAVGNWWGDAGGPGVGGANPISSFVNAGSPETAPRSDVPPP